MIRTAPGAAPGRRRFVPAVYTHVQLTCVNVTVHESKVTSVQKASSREVTSRMRRSIRHRRAFRRILWTNVGWIGFHAAAACSLRNGCLLWPVNAYPSGSQRVNHARRVVSLVAWQALV
jgi:hypothetical protein